MDQPTLEQRVARLEQQVTELQDTLSQAGQSKDWRRTIGMFAGDDLMKEVFDEALNWTAPLSCRRPDQDAAVD